MLRSDFTNNNKVFEFKNINPNVKNLRYVLHYKSIYYILDDDLLIYTTISIKEVNEYLNKYILNNEYRYTRIEWVNGKIKIRYN